MQVIISSSCPLGGGGQGNVVRYFAEGLYVKGILHSVITSRLVHADIPYDKIIETYPIIAGLVYKIPRLKWNLKSLIRDRLHDILASYKIRQCDILYGWANNSLLTFKKAQELNIITCLEVPTSHISNRLKIIKEEDPVSVYNAIKKLYKGLGKQYEFCIDITGGRKTMSSGALLFAKDKGLKCYYFWLFDPRKNGSKKLDELAERIDYELIRVHELWKK